MTFNYAMTLRSRHLVFRRTGQEPEPPLEMRSATGFTALHRRKVELLARAGDAIYRRRAFPSDATGRSEAIRPLAEAGWNLFAAMFDEPERERFLALVASVPVDEPMEVRFARLSEGAPVWIPWNLVYVDAGWGEPDVSNFLGARLLTVEAMFREEFLGPPIADLGLELAERHFGFVDDDLLCEPGCRRSDAERDMLAELYGRRFRALDPLRPDDFGPELERYAGFVAEAGLGLHFATHGFKVEDEPRDYRMRVSTAFEHRVQDLADCVRAQGGLAHLPFAFLNACHSASQGLAGEFAGSGHFSASGVRATVGASTGLCDSLAEDFASRFYRLAIHHGLPVGEAFRQARDGLLGEDGNPAVLVYQLTGDPGLDLRG